MFYVLADLFVFIVLVDYLVSSVLANYLVFSVPTNYPVFIVPADYLVFSILMDYLLLSVSTDYPVFNVSIDYPMFSVLADSICFHSQSMVLYIRPLLRILMEFHFPIHPPIRPVHHNYLDARTLKCSLHKARSFKHHKLHPATSYGGM
ncbi:hypothetical protein PVK06_008740 [Gossypium arboreum]|uniref:Uncharacterized protein n=1 Tax=Gossypium arboreum TaxID=29729 RepID=A0ABR0QM31_GOSAR|nr:hypothetical protein PVK06_008740 [Gossypium arboreum]